MTTPLDPVIADIIPRLPLRDTDTMTPQSARDALRALAASRAAVPPPPVESVSDIQVKGAAGPLAARVYRVSHETSPTADPGRKGAASRCQIVWNYFPNAEKQDVPNRRCSLAISPYIQSTNNSGTELFRCLCAILSLPPPVS